MRHTYLTTIDKQFYRCDVTGWIYEILQSKYKNILRFECVSGAKKHIINKYTKDIKW